MRKARGLLAGLGLTNDKIALSAQRLARAREALEASVDALQRDARLESHAGAFASLGLAAWRAAPEELRLRLLGRSILSFGGQPEPLPLAQLEALAERMMDAGFEGATLAGCIVSRHGESVRVQREAGREPLPALVLAPGATAIWDHRFRVASARESPAPVVVRALGPQAYAQLRRQLDAEPGLPASAAATLPSFWHEDQLLFVPGLADLPPAAILWGSRRRLYAAEFLG